MGRYLFTSESVATGHPDKIADQISDAILDACLEQDPYSRVACETMVCPGLVILGGEITTHARVDYQAVVRQKIKEIGYDDGALGFDYRSCGIIQTINRQSPDIAQGVDEDETREKEIGAGDQGIMFGFATDETDELMPMPICLAHQIVMTLQKQRETGKLPYLRPDAKAQVTIEYEGEKPVRLATVVLSTQHDEKVKQETIRGDMQELIRSIVPKELDISSAHYFINPTGRFVIGGPVGDCGLTGRKIIIDTYGGMGRHGGGAFSGKDPTKVDRSACYAARWVAKNIVAAKLAKRCEIQLSYAIGVSHPISLKIDTFGTGILPDEKLAEIVSSLFNLSPSGIIRSLDLRRPIYQKTAVGGHFGRNDPDFRWESTDKVEQILQAVDPVGSMS